MTEGPSPVARLDPDELMTFTLFLHKEDERSILVSDHPNASFRIRQRSLPKPLLRDLQILSGGKKVVFRMPRYLAAANQLSVQELS